MEAEEQLAALKKDLSLNHGSASITPAQVAASVGGGPTQPVVPISPSTISSPKLSNIIKAIAQKP